MPLRFNEYGDLKYGDFDVMNSNYQAFLYGEKLDVGGGRIEKEEIDILQQHPELTRISVAGLHQDTFDYFVENYGSRFKAIYFFKNKMVSDLSSLGKLDNLEVLAYFANQRAEKLWDMSGNKSLKMLGINDFSRLHDLSGIEKAPSLECLSFGNLVWLRSNIDFVPNMENSTLKMIGFNASVDYTGIYRFLSIKGLERLDFRSNLFPMEFLAWICANYPELKGNCISLKPYVVFEEGDAEIFGKGKRRVKNVHDEKSKRYLDKIAEEFECMKKRFKGLSFDDIVSLIG